MEVRVRRERVDGKGQKENSGHFVVGPSNPTQVFNISA